MKNQDIKPEDAMKHRNLQRILITILRVSIGWHFIYEGMVKIMAEEWSSAAYLANATGFLSGFYRWMANTPVILEIVDIMNVYGLLLIGLGLFLGFLVRYAAYAGTILLLLYYFAYPPYGFTSFYSTEGSFFIVNKVMIEALILAFLAFYREKGYSLDSLFIALFRKKGVKAAGEAAVDPASRREALKNIATLPALGLLGWGAVRNNKKYDIDVFSGATIQAENTLLSELKGELPRGNLCGHQISRLVLGGNLIGGWAHTRDLIYGSALFKAYNTEKKIYETLDMAEKTGINTINIGFVSNPVLERYKKISGSKIKVISQVSFNPNTDQYFEQIDRAIDHGSEIIQIQGNCCDRMVMDNRTEVIGRMLDHIRAQGLTAGLGAHAVQALVSCKEFGITPDYYMLTMHHDQYWSAHPRENRHTFEVMSGRNKEHEKWNDNIWCQFPEKAIDFVDHTDLPVMGFKVLAAGAIHPKDGFNWAFKNGADFICVGMFDFQLVNDVNICIETLDNLNDRKRKWMA